MFKNKNLLITGGTGSFGNAVLKRFLNSDVNEIRVLSRDEKKQNDMRTYIKNDKLKFFIGDVRDINSIRPAMHNIDYVFHAAALKQVPSCEFHPIEAVNTNIIGANNVLESASIYNVEKVIVLSTDKAVYPINAMGISKAMMEKVMIGKSRHSLSETIFCGTRYGNVMGSRGSVIPLFINQIKNNLPITVTNPEMTRFMMNLDEAVDLVLYAYQNGTQGDIFVQKSPSSTIINIAMALKDIFNSNTEIKILGTRHGEKKHETLLTREEMSKAKELEKYFQISADHRDLNYDKYFTNGTRSDKIIDDYNSFNTINLNLDETKELLLNQDFVQNAINNKESSDYSYNFK